MNLKSKIFFCFLFIHLGFSTCSLFAQSENSNNFIQQLSDFYRLKKYDSVISFSDKLLENLKAKTTSDSILFAKIHVYKYSGLHEKKKGLKNLSSLQKAILYCPSSYTGDSLKATIYNRKAYLESELGSHMESYKSISESLKLLEKLDQPNNGYLMGAYLLLSNNNAYFGNFEQAKFYMRLAEKVYAKHKIEIDKNTWELNGNHHRLGVIAKYRKIYMLWKMSKNTSDSLPMISAMKDLEKMHKQPDFHKEEKVYYSTALNHVGDWFASHKYDSLATKKDIKLGLTFLLKSHHLVRNKNYPGTLWAIKYNIAKAYTNGNQLEKADSTMIDLFHGISKTDRRLPFFFAQKGLIKARKEQKDSALFYFDKSIEKIHSNNIELKANYSNFKPSKSYNHTRLILRISEELNNHYPKDSIVQKKVAKLYYMALQQFENSYLSTSFNSTQNNQLRKIIHGILKAEKTGFLNGEIQQKSLLDKFEIFKNQLAWKKFYESRYTNTLPELDSVKKRKLALATLLNKAKISDNISQTDSIQSLINQHKSFIKKQFPQLSLLSDFKFSIEKLQENLTAKDLILKYIILEDEIARYQISKNTFEVNLMPWTDIETKNLKDFIYKIRNKKQGLKLAFNLSKKLIPDLSKNITNLIINPDGLLFTLPFEVLQINENLAAELYNIRYTSNLGFIHYSSDKKKSLKNIHIYAPAYSQTDTQFQARNKASFLIGATNEAKTISELFPSKLFNDKNLTKSTFIKTAGKAKILHLAMHAEVNNEYPQLSRFLFDNSLKNEDNHLYLEELYGLSLSAELAILSACNTGNGSEKNGNLESFQRAFTFAGVSSTVASLWEVPDLATKEIMILFYKNLKAGQTKSLALRNAKLSFKIKNANTKLSAPYFWAGFVIYGDDDAVIQTSSFIYFYIIVAVFAILFTVWFRKKIRSKLL